MFDLLYNCVHSKIKCNQRMYNAYGITIPVFLLIKTCYVYNQLYTCSWRQCVKRQFCVGDGSVSFQFKRKVKKKWKRLEGLSHPAFNCTKWSGYQTTFNMKWITDGTTQPRTLRSRLDLYWLHTCILDTCWRLRDN